MSHHQKMLVFTRAYLNCPNILQSQHFNNVIVSLKTNNGDFVSFYIQLAVFIFRRNALIEINKIKGKMTKANWLRALILESCFLSFTYHLHQSISQSKKGLMGLTFFERLNRLSQLHGRFS